MSAEKNQKKSNNSIGRGGARAGAGRKKGAATKRTREIADRAAAEGITPLEYMLTVLRSDSDHEDPKIQAQREMLRFEAAKAAAPYMHPRLTAVDLKADVNLSAAAASDDALTRIALGANA